jgi:hypothetical protein
VSIHPDDAASSGATIIKIITMKRVIFTFLVCLVCIISKAQTTYFNGSWSPGASECGRLTCVEIRDDGVVVTIEIKASFKKVESIQYL